MKKMVALTVSLIVLTASALIGYGVYHTVSSRPTFDMAGYILQGGVGESKQLAFDADATYVANRMGTISFQGVDGEQTVGYENFVYYQDSSIMALTGGVLLDFNDLSDNFINNYYIPGEMVITSSEGVYTAYTSSGEITFGEHMWKLSDNKYLIRSPQLSVYFSDEDIRDVEDYVQVVVTDDGLIQLLTSENLWITISDQCYIQTQGGVTINPVLQLIEDGTYKMSLAKFSADADDNIVLSESETRRQIVPELNFEAVDGEDGDEGSAGQSGTHGQAGIEGQSGIIGDEGIEGEQGVAGEAGMAGAAGVIGTDGDNGDKGTSGTSGSDGTDGATGESGVGGANGSVGATGATGADGKDATGSSTTQSLPEITITDWNLSSSGLKGIFYISDESELLMATSYLYPGTMTITNNSTGEIIPVYQVASSKYDDNPDDGIDLGEEGFYPLNNDGEVCFATYGDALDPDTAYTLSFIAYYYSYDGGVMYSREFIYRTFYTDSCGITLMEDDATTTSITVDAYIGGDGSDDITMAYVFLLTADQNQAFDINYSTQYAYALNYSTGQITAPNGGETTAMSSNSYESLVFSDLTPNTTYIARVIVTKTDGTSVTQVSPQELTVQTLKRTPTVSSGSVTVYYNRVYGEFQVTCPIISDPDGAVEYYIYTMYDAEGNAVESRTVTASSTTTVGFVPPDDSTYSFGVAMQYYDNEKTVTVDLGTTEGVSRSGDDIPVLTLSKNVDNSDYDKYAGTLVIDMGLSTSLDVSTNRPLTLTFGCDAIPSLSRTIEITSVAELVSVDASASGVGYDITLNAFTEQQATISLNFDGLQKNTSYTITVGTWLDLNTDGDETTEEYVSYTIGTVGFYTENTISSRAEFSLIGTTTGQLNYNLVIELAADEDAYEDAREAYAIEQLTEGFLRIEFYTGQGENKVLSRYVEITDPAVLADIYTTEGVAVDGLDITADYMNATLVDGGKYTLQIATMADGSYNDYANNGGVVYNEYDLPSSYYVTIEKEATAHDLLDDPTKGVVYTPIYNSNASAWSGTTDPTLPDDAIVGYYMRANYDNISLLATEVTYYVMEYKEFYDAVIAGSEPLSNDSIYRTLEVTLPVDAYDTTIPGIAVLFDQGIEPARGNTETIDDGTNYDYYTVVSGRKYYTYFMNSPTFSDGHMSNGMSRGYRYLFAYDLVYNASSGSYKNYPYEVDTYETYKNAYGVGKQNGTAYMGQTQYYLLNSGLVDLPKIEPEVVSYVASSTLDGLTNGTTSGTAYIDFTYTEYDDVINDSTKVNYPQSNSASSIYMTTALFSDLGNFDTSANGDKWYRVGIPYTTTDSTSGAMSRPYIELERYNETVIDYTVLEQAFNIATDTSFYLAQFPMEWNWQTDIGVGYDNGQGTAGVMVDMYPSYQTNLIEFVFTYATGYSSLFTNLINQMYYAQITFSDPDGELADIVLYEKIYQDSASRYVAQVSTGDITAYLESDYIATVEILYRSGTMGWGLVENPDNDKSNPYGIRSFTRTSGFDDIDIYGFVGASDVPSTGLYYQGTYQSTVSSTTDDSYTYRTNITTEDLRDTLGADTRLYLRSTKVTSTYTYDTKYLYPTHYGVDVASTSTSGNANSYYIPVGVASYTFAEETGTMESMVPVVSTFYSTNTTYTASATRLTVDGATTLGVDWVRLTLHETREAAQSATDAIGYILIDMNNANTWYSDGTQFDILDTFNDNTGMLSPNTTYYVGAQWVDGLNVTIDSAYKEILFNSSGTAYYTTITTNGSVSISAVDTLQYKSTSYYDKSITFTYQVSRYSGIQVEYSLWTTAAAAASGTGDPCIDGDTLNDLIVETVNSGSSLKSYTNTITLDLEPGKQEELWGEQLIINGGSYYLRVELWEESELEGETMGSVGVWSGSVSLPAVSSWTSLAVTDVGAHSVTFRFSMSDSLYAYMGQNTDLESTSMGLYAVRFTDDEGTLINTIYDDVLYPTMGASAIITEYTLYGGTYTEDGEGTRTIDASDQTSWTITDSSQLDPSQTYHIYIFAVEDKDLDGQSPVYALASDETTELTRTGEEFFEPDADHDDTTFMKYVDSFWTGQGYKNDETRAYYSNFEIETLSRTTTDATGLEIGYGIISRTSGSSTGVQLELKNSYGVVSADGTSKIKKIVWSVTGMSYEPLYINTVETVLESTSGTLFTTSTVTVNGVSTTSYLYKRTDLPQGDYTITASLYQNEDDTEPVYTLTGGVTG